MRRGTRPWKRESGHKSVDIFSVWEKGVPQCGALGTPSNQRASISRAQGGILKEYFGRCKKKSMPIGTTKEMVQLGSVSRRGNLYMDWGVT